MSRAISLLLVAAMAWGEVWVTPAGHPDLLRPTSSWNNNTIQLLRRTYIHDKTRNGYENVPFDLIDHSDLYSTSWALRLAGVVGLRLNRSFRKRTIVMLQNSLSELFTQQIRHRHPETGLPSMYQLYLIAQGFDSIGFTVPTHISHLITTIAGNLYDRASGLYRADLNSAPDINASILAAEIHNMLKIPMPIPKIATIHTSISEAKSLSEALPAYQLLYLTHKSSRFAVDEKVTVTRLLIGALNGVTTKPVNAASINVYTTVDNILTSLGYRMDTGNIGKGSVVARSIASIIGGDGLAEVDGPGSPADYQMTFRVLSIFPAYMNSSQKAHVVAALRTFELASGGWAPIVEGEIDPKSTYEAMRILGEFGADAHRKSIARYYMAISQRQEMSAENMYYVVKIVRAAGLSVPKSIVAQAEDVRAQSLPEVYWLIRLEAVLHEKPKYSAARQMLSEAIAKDAFTKYGVEELYESIWLGVHSGLVKQHGIGAKAVSEWRQLLGPRPIGLPRLFFWARGERLLGVAREVRVNGYMSGAGGFDMLPLHDKDNVATVDSTYYGMYLSQMLSR